jgi:hypothetical protein
MKLLFIIAFGGKGMNILTHKKTAIGAALLSFASLSQAAITIIDFDTDASGAAINAPNLFSSATALTELYAAKGVHFTALERKQVTEERPHNGVLKTFTENQLSPVNSGMGAILNDSSGFRGPAKSGDNFLAFNGETAFDSHFWRISFDNPIGFFDIDRRRGAEPDNNFFIHLDAYDAEGNKVGSRNNLYNPSGWTSDGYRGYRSSFKTETEISYVDIGHALDRGGNTNASLRSTPWAIVYDNLKFGDFADATSGTQFLSGGGTFIPVPGSIWFLLTGLIGFGSLVSKRKITEI